MDEFINLTKENIDNEYLCCLIREKNSNYGVEEKRNWLKDRIKEGHIYRKLNKKCTVFIEYAKLEYSWVPIKGKNFYYIYCLWVEPSQKNKRYGSSLLNYCIKDALKNNMSGICMLGSTKQKAWLSDQKFAKKYGFEIVDSTNSGYELLALSFDGTKPEFTLEAKKEKIISSDLTIYYNVQCPFIYKNILSIKDYCDNNKIPLNLIKINTLKEAKEVPSPFNNYSVFYNNQFITVNLLNVDNIKKIINIKN